MWQPFQDGQDLRRQVLDLLASHLQERAAYYGLSPLELTRLEAWRSGLEASVPALEDGERVGAGGSGVVLSRERYLPSNGVLIQGGDDAEAV